MIKKLVKHEEMQPELTAKMCEEFTVSPETETKFQVFTLMQHAKDTGRPITDSMLKFYMVTRAEYLKYRNEFQKHKP